MLEDETLAQLRVHTVEPKWWNAKSIVIYCGMTPEVWADPSTITGIGGSEEAVIHLSREFVKMGYDVTVFNNCAEMAGVYNGVTYRSIFEFNPRDFYNILISWRKNIFSGIQAKKRIVWYHDVPIQDTFCTKEEIDSFDRLVVLSNFHRTLFPKVPDEKIFVSTNGINPSDFVDLNVNRQKNRIIYASSYDRGLEVLLDGWKEIKTAVPDAELHIFYGWNSFDGFRKAGYDTNLSFKDSIEQKMKQDGIFHHGRVGHKELVKEYAKSEYYAYPCTFEEINCIALTKGTATGCKVITSDYASVGERNKHGLQCKVSEFTNTLISVLNGDTVAEPCKDIQKYLEENSWLTVANDWKKELFKVNR
jgi:glycosyltransferase involved in cell wall biosynthesis